MQLCDLDELLRESDFISLHLPGSPGTAQLINAAAIARMKPGVRLINTARAALIDEPALAAALRDGNVAGLACDVFSEEPVPASNLLLQCPNVIATPHLASASRESLERLGDMAAAAVIAVLSGREPPSRLA
ncbi:Glyoxylate/hydroxypyruvate reductase B [bioreactor metagenome]|uniref:Glyoxylate/hydroxypyruvate reductase B n=1 Tax=bioreactor metagenome TaxID=1076179 RepID=A0A645IP56_9ZZZZ